MNQDKVKERFIQSGFASGRRKLNCPGIMMDAEGIITLLKESTVWEDIMNQLGY